MPLTEKQKDIIAKLEHPAGLSIDERRFVRDTLLKKWLTFDEWRDLKRQRQLEQYELAKELARHVVPHGQREKFVQALYRKSRKTLAQFIRRKRKRS